MSFFNNNKNYNNDNNKNNGPDQTHFFSHTVFSLPNHSSHKVTEQPKCAHKPAVYRDPKTLQPCRNSEEERTDKYRQWNFLECEQAVDEGGKVAKDSYTYTIFPPLQYFMSTYL